MLARLCLLAALVGLGLVLVIVAAAVVLRRGGAERTQREHRGDHDFPRGLAVEGLHLGFLALRAALQTFRQPLCARVMNLF
jgi:hypothetical protein